MTAQLLSGVKVAAAELKKVRLGVKALCRKHGRPPGLAILLVGEDRASDIYVRNKIKACERIGMKVACRRLSYWASTAELSQYIESFNNNPKIDGIVVQLPLPPTIDTSSLIDHINPSKDVDGFHPFNIGCLALRRPALRPATSKGVMRLIAHTGINPRGLSALILGASNHVGRPMGLELLLAGCTVTTVHRFSREEDKIALIKSADILISAVGKPGLVHGEWIKPGAIVIDIGITRDEAGKLRGDLDFPGAMERAAWVTPVPGGVGPMTVAALLSNTLEAARATLAGRAKQQKINFQDIQDIQDFQDFQPMSPPPDLEVHDHDSISKPGSS